MKRPFWKSKMDKMIKRNFQTEESVGKVGQRGGLFGGCQGCRCDRSIIN